MAASRRNRAGAASQPLRSGPAPAGPEILLRAGGRLQPRQLLDHHRRRRHLDRRHGRRLMAAARGPCSEPADDSDPAAPRYDPAAPFATAGPPPVTLLRAGGRRGHQQRLDRLRRRSRFDRSCRLAAAARQPAASGFGPAHSGPTPVHGPAARGHVYKCLFISTVPLGKQPRVGGLWEGSLPIGRHWNCVSNLHALNLKTPERTPEGLI